MRDNGSNIGTYMKRALVAVFIILAELSAFAYAKQPKDVLQELIDQGINILKDPLYKNAGQKRIQRQKLSEIVNQAVILACFRRDEVEGSTLKNFETDQLQLSLKRNLA